MSWVFAYGSLIWRPAFAYEERRPAFVRGYARRFWQASPDHRGTPEAPGRVATLVPEDGAVCGGCAYRLDASAADAILAALDVREQAGFERKVVALFDAEGVHFADGLVWIAPHDNAYFVREDSVAAIADVVRARHGPSGSNAEYVRELDAALRALGVHDEHVRGVARALD